VRSSTWTWLWSVTVSCEDTATSTAACAHCTAVSPVFCAAGWVGTLGSMWSTLTERLRSTVRCKADKPYTDAHGTLAGLGSV
jgi:hypothetical protein